MKQRNGLGGWWPVFPDRGAAERPVYDPYRKNLSDRQRFEIAAGAILTQNTAWTNVEKALRELRNAGVLSLDGISRIRRSRLARLIRAAGYFNQKARHLKALAKFLRGLHFRDLQSIDIGTLREKLIDVKGVGPETADSILLYALGKPVFVVDAYTRRIFSRHGWIRGDEAYEEIRMWFEKNLPKSVSLWNDYHAQIVEIGKTRCHRRRPECRECPLGRRELFASPEDFSKVMS